MRAQIVSLFTPFLFFALLSSAQDETEQSDAPKSYFKASFEYLSNSVYMGRKDSIAIPYLTPELSYHFKSGFYLSANASYLSSESRIDASTIGAGYAFSKRKWDGEIVAEKYFYSSQSYNVHAETKADLSASLGYNIGFIEPQVSTFINFATRNDYGGSFGLEHDFSLFEDRGDLTPAFVVNAGTQNAYSQYYKKRKYTKTRKGKTISYTAVANTLNTSQFKVLDYEFSAPFEFTPNRFTFSFTPTVAVPVNPSIVALTIKSSNGGFVSKTFTEKLSTTFFWSVGIAYKIKGK